MSEIKTIIQRLAGTFGLDLVYKLTCSVDSIDLDDRSCMVTPINNNLASFKAQLMAETDDGVLILPAEQSTVKVLYSNLNAPTVIQYSQIDQVFIVASGSTFKIYESGIELDGINFGGVMKVVPSVKAWNDVQNDINKLKQAFAAWSPASGDGGAALKAALTSVYPTAPLAVTNKSDVENVNVQHGDGS